MVGPGRPRDPGLEARVQGAACRVYGRHGWSSFSIEAVAREASVGKASIYARWSSKEDLLIESLAAQVAFDVTVDTGGVRDDLVVLAGSVLNFYQGEYGDAALRLMTESRLNPDLSERFEKFSLEYMRAARAVVRRAVRRGELGPETPVTELLECLFGGVVMHVLTTKAGARRTTATNHLESLVDLLLEPAEPAG